jgi:hypothetical protein
MQPRCASGSGSIISTSTRKTDVPVQKFRSYEEMNATPLPPRIRNAGDAFDRFVRHCRPYRKLAQRRHPRGVFKFRSLEEAQAARRDLPPEGGSRTS